jgi:hypothetical protein
MQYFKTIGDMLSYQFEQDGMKTDSGEPIKATGQPMTEAEYAEYKKEQIQLKADRLHVATTNPNNTK